MATVAVGVWVQLLSRPVPSWLLAIPYTTTGLNFAKEHSLFDSTLILASLRYKHS